MIILVLGVTVTLQILVVLGDITSTTLTGYNGLPIYTTDSPITLINSTSSGSSSIQFKIGAKSTTTQLAGNYTNTINFTAVAKANPPTFDDLFAAAGKTKYNGYYKLQDMGTDICSTTDIGANTTLIDIRDDQLYTVAKLKDNRCWMIDNLNLGDIDNHPLKTNTLNSTNTNVNTEISTETFNSWKSPNGPHTYTEAKYVSISGFDTTSQTSYGTLYNYCAASAGTYCTPGSTDIGNAKYDLCPTGWRIPTLTYDNNGEFGELYTYYDSHAKMRTSLFDGGAALRFAEMFRDGTISGQRANGSYWSSTSIDDGVNMKYLLVAWSTIVFSANGRTDGYSIRCIAK